MPEREKFQRYKDGEVVMTKIGAVLVFVLCVIGTILCFTGGAKMTSSVTDALKVLNTKIDLVLGDVKKFENAIQDPVTGKMPDGFSLGMFSNATTAVKNMQSNLDRILESSLIKMMMSLLGYVPGLIMCVGLLLSILLLLAMLCSVRTCLPISVVLVGFLFQLVFLILASVFLIVVLVVGIGDNEMQLQQERQKGIFQWYVVPLCENKLPLKSVVDNTDQMTSKAMYTACEGLVNVCSAGSAWDPRFSGKVFECNVTNAEQCTTLQKTVGTFNSVKLKSGSPVGCTGQSTCTLRECATLCNDADVKKNAQLAVTGVDTLERVMNAFNQIIRKWLDCNYLVDQVLAVPRVFFATTGRLFRELSAGYLIGGIGLVLGIVIGFLGQKRFFKKSETQYVGAWAWTRQRGLPSTATTLSL